MPVAQPLSKKRSSKVAAAPVRGAGYGGSPSRSRASRVRESIAKQSTPTSWAKQELETLEGLFGAAIDFIANESFSGCHDMPADCSHFARAIEQGELRIDAKKSTGLPSHLARMCETPLLTPEQETELFRRMNLCKYRASVIRERLSVSTPKPEELARAIRYLGRAENLRNYLINANTRLVISIARRFADARNSFDDLLSLGLSSLMHSVEKFDYDRGYRFSTYATCAVRRDLYRSVMGRKKDSQRFTTGAAEQLSSCTDYRVNEEEITESGYHHLRKSLEEMLATLDERERMILMARFGLDGGRKKASYSTLGETLGISKERVRQLANRAMEKMRAVVPEYRLEGLLS